MKTNHPEVSGSLEKIKRHAGKIDGTLRIMEVCGTHTVAIQRCGLRSILPENVRLIAGPGCPVCVTPAGYIDGLIQLAEGENTLIATYGDMVRVKGSRCSLADKRAEGANIRVVLSASDALKLAMENPSIQVIFAAVGFETTTPQTADVILRAAHERLDNFSALTAHKLVIPAMHALLSMEECLIDGFLCPGHVSIMIGADAYRPLVDLYRKPCAIAGFEPLQILRGLACLLEQLAEDRPRVDNVYPAVVKSEPMPSARKLVETVFEPTDTEWRALGTLPASGLKVRQSYRNFDSQVKFGLTLPMVDDPPGCRCAEVILGQCDPPDCPLFGGRCNQASPVGPCMVSFEGACQAWYKYQ